MRGGRVWQCEGWRVWVVGGEDTHFVLLVLLTEFCRQSARRWWDRQVRRRALPRP